jgi:N-acylneuraminate cytidylyltransferase/CMP-N,N'-diacetyllegionaminic acid synthase
MNNTPPLQILALIPARGGSKGIPGKNIRPLGGNPLLVHTFEAARKSRVFDRIILSTDDPAIADVAAQYGLDTPFIRPAHLADDRSSVVAATEHALNWLADNQCYSPTFVMLLQPTSPFRSAEDIRQCASMLNEQDTDAVISVSPCTQHPALLKKITAEGHLQPLQESPPARRQDFSPLYALNGAIYLVRTSVLRAQRTWCPANARAYIMPRERSLDIDEPLDFEFAEWFWQRQQSDASPASTPSETLHLEARS